MRFRNGVVPRFFRPCLGPTARECPDAFRSQAGLKEDRAPATRTSVDDWRVGGGSDISGSQIDQELELRRKAEVRRSVLRRFIFDRLVDGNDLIGKLRKSSYFYGTDFNVTASVLGVTPEALREAIRTALGVTTETLMDAIRKVAAEEKALKKRVAAETEKPR